MSTPEVFRAAIVGLGQVGMLFDADTRRTGIWTHFAAYERLATSFDLVAACDPDDSRLAEARRRRPALQGYGTLGELLDVAKPDVVSLCTPPEFHAGQIAECAGRVKAIICEKPLSAESATGRAAVAACAETGTLLAINYYKRFDGAVPTIKALLDEGRLGKIKLVNAIYCGPLDAVGSHMIDLLRFLLGELEIATGASIAGDRASVSLRAANDTLVHLHNVGPREEFIFELDVIGDEGRVRLLDNCARGEFFRYRDSDRYSGYRELYPEPMREIAPAERFLPLFVETAEWLRGERMTLTSDGENALRTQLLIDEIARELPA